MLCLVCQQVSRTTTFKMLVFWMEFGSIGKFNSRFLFSKRWPVLNKLWNSSGVTRTPAFGGETWVRFPLRHMHHCVLNRPPRRPLNSSRLSAAVCRRAETRSSNDALKLLVTNSTLIVHQSHGMGYTRLSHDFVAFAGGVPSLQTPPRPYIDFEYNRAAPNTQPAFRL